MTVCKFTGYLMVIIAKSVNSNMNVLQFKTNFQIIFRCHRIISMIIIPDLKEFLNCPIAFHVKFIHRIQKYFCIKVIPWKICN